MTTGRTRGMRRLFSGAAALAFAAASLSVGPAGPALAAPDDDARGRLYQVRTEGAARNDEKEFRRHADRGEWRPAILRLQDLLDVPPSRNVVFEVPGAGPPRFENVSRAARRLFDSLPPEGRAAWEQLQRAPAEELLSRGIRTRSTTDLEQARTRYPAPDVRRRAHDALAWLAVAEGDFDRAAAELEGLLSVCEAGEMPTVLARLAFARANAGDLDGVARVGAAAASRASATVEGPRGPAPLSAFLASMTDVARANAPLADGARLFTGDRTGAGRAEPPPPRLDAGWTAPTGFIPGTERAEFGGTPEHVWYHPVRPLVAQGRAIVTDGRRVRALEIASGRRLWEVRGSSETLPWRDAPVQSHAPALADGTVYAALATRSDRSGTASNATVQGRRIVFSLPHRAMHAIDLRTGDLLWRHDAESIESLGGPADFDRESVASPPLVVGEEVYFTTWAYNTRYEVRLVCCDRRTGAIRWRATLATGQQEANLFGRPVKELWTSAPVERDGRIFAATGVGIVACVDRIGGAVEWLSEYEQHPIPDTVWWFETVDRIVTLRPSSACATPDAFVVGPADSPHVTAFDPRDGAVLWRRESSPSDGRSIAWILGWSSGRIYVLGSRAGCIDARTGADLWSGDAAGRLAPEGRQTSQPIGPGLLTKDTVWVPTPAALVGLDAQTGRWTQQLAWPAARAGRGSEALRRTGALATGDGALLLVSADGIEAFYAAEALMERVEARVRERPDDAWVRLEAAEALRAALRLDAAMVHYREGIERVAKLPPGARESVDRGLRSGIVQAALARAAARRAAGDANGAIADLRTASSMASDRGEKARALLGLAAALVAADRVDEQRATLESVAADLPDVETTVDGFDGRVAAGALARLLLAETAASEKRTDDAVRHWFDILARQPDAPLGASTAAVAVRMRLESFLESSGDAARRAVLDRASAMLDAARKSGDGAAAALLSRTIPDGAFAADAALAASDAETAAGRPRAAAAVLETLLARSSPKGDLLARTLRSLAASYRALDETSRERRTLRRMAEECAGLRLPDGTAAEAWASQELTSPRFRDGPSIVADPRPPLRLVVDSMEDGAPRAIPVAGRAPRGAEDTVFLVGDRVAALLSAETGSFQWRSIIDVDPRVVSGSREQFILSGDDAQTGRGARVAALRASDGSRLWSRRIPGQWLASVTAMGVAYVLAEDTDEQGNRITRLTAWSAETGDPVGERILPASMSPVVATAGDALVVYEQIRGTSGASPRRHAIVLDAATLSPRGIVDIEQWDSNYHVPVAGTSLLVTTAQLSSVSAIDTASGTRAWGPITFRDAQVKSVLPAADGVLVADTKHRVRLLSAADGSEKWTRDLAPLGSLGIYGEAAEGDLYVATVLGPGSENQATAVALDSATGEVRWTRKLPLQGRVTRVIPVPRALRNVVAYELPERPAETLRNRIVLLDRATGAVSATIDHARMSGSRFQSVYSGRAIALSDPVAGLVIYSGVPDRREAK